LDNLLANSIHIFFPVAISAGAALMLFSLIFWLFNAFGELLEMVRGGRQVEFDE